MQFSREESMAIKSRGTILTRGNAWTQQCRDSINNRGPTAATARWRGQHAEREDWSAHEVGWKRERGRENEA